MLLCRRLSAKTSLASLLSSSSPPPCASAFYRFLSSPPPPQEAPTVSLNPNPNFAAQYLINSCDLSPERAVRVSRYLPTLKFTEKPDSVLRFLRQAGVTEAHIKAAALRQPGFLCYSIENCFKPRMAELRELGFSQSDISLLLSIFPLAFGYTKLQQKVRLWLGFFGSVEKLLCVLKTSFRLLSVDLENTVVLNLAFLREQCGLPARRIHQLVDKSPSTITCKPQIFKMYIKRTQDLGVSCSSGMFVYVLRVISKLNESIVDARMCYLESLGFSQEEVALLIGKCPTILTQTEKFIGKKMEFLIKDVGCVKSDVFHNPTLLAYSLEKRLIPRSLVRKILKSKGIPEADKAFVSFVTLPENQFLKRYVLPYEEALPGLHQAYTDACASNTTATG